MLVTVISPDAMMMMRASARRYLPRKIIKCHQRPMILLAWGVALALIMRQGMGRHWHDAGR